MDSIIRYMGTKASLANDVAEAISSLKPGPFTDAFCGMCAVARAIGSDRQISAIDAQYFAAEAAAHILTSGKPIQTSEEFSAELHVFYIDHLKLLSNDFQNLLNIEKNAMALNTADSMAIANLEIRQAHNICDSLSNIKLASPNTNKLAYNLFTTNYGATYFGLFQCMEIDSIRYALDIAMSKETINTDEWQWGILALGSAMQRVATTTGHFAQYLEPKTNTLKPYMKQRNKSVWGFFINSLREIYPIGSSQWRKENKVFQGDSLEVLASEPMHEFAPSVIYADPPYTDDQYSRYYHLLDTMLLYDYPVIEHKGLYRLNRFKTSFSLKATVKEAMESLVSSCARLQADMVLSYPNNGLLHELNIDPETILSEEYKCVSIWKEINHSHSTLGASKGVSRESVTELIYVAKQK